jgi:eukaryotic-like serine/threonine-protein kinase
MASRRELAERLFMTALALEPTERSAFLSKACNNNSELRRMVEDLLADNARVGSFIQSSPFNLIGRIKMNITETPDSAKNSNADLEDNLAGRFSPGHVLIDRFVVIRFIAKGGMGEVYEVEDRFLPDVHVAMKTILPYIAGDPDQRRHFEREVLLARKLSHPNLCPIYDIFHSEQESPEFLFLTMKLLPGETMAARLKRPGSISMEEGQAILKQAVLGIATIHAAGIVHRDIKPNNIMLDGTGPHVHLCVTDFGLARIDEAEVTISGRGEVAGTPDYIAPELFLGHLPSQASDLFALGVVLHQVFTGRKPTVGPDDSFIEVNTQLKASGLPAPAVHLITECLSEDPERRCQAFEQTLVALSEEGWGKRKHGFWTRRRFIAAATATVGLASAGVWREWDQIENFLHPLPRRRFVALLNWPKTSDVQLIPTLTGVLAAIKSELARLEVFDRDFFVISAEDASVDITDAARLKEICDPLGTNLVLAASGWSASEVFQLFLRLIDPSSTHALREKKITCSMDEITFLPAKAVHAAGSLLNLGRYQERNPPARPSTQSAAAFTAFQSAEALMGQSNDAGLDAGIEKYLQAVELDSHYALAYARLAQAYVHLYSLRGNSGALELARGNCERALALDPDLVEGYVAKAVLLEQIGDEEGALDQFGKAIALDPSNAETLVNQALVYVRLNRFEDAEETYSRVLKERPNWWVIHNDLGYTLDRQGKYQEAIKAFRAASVAAPRSAMAFANLGAEYLKLGDFTAAIENLKKSQSLNPNDAQAAETTSQVLRLQGKYDEALPFALKAVHLDPVDDINWLELGDCYSSLHNRSGEAKGAYLRAAKEVERHLQTDATNGPDWMLLALYRVKSGDPETALSLIKKAESLGATDMDSQLYKARIFELLGKRPEALATLNECFHKGASALQIELFPDLQSLRTDPRYRQIAESKLELSPK